MIRTLPVILYVEWLDASSAGHHSAWTQYDEFRDSTSHTDLTCVSVGYLIREDDTRLVIAAHLTLNDPELYDETIGECSGTLIIPKGTIVSRRELS